jgi:peroxiredoxin
MKYTNKFYLLSILIVFSCTQENKKNIFSADAKELAITTKKKSGFGELPISFGEIDNFKETPGSPWEKMIPDYKGIPDTLKNLFISTNPLNWEQFVYQSFNSGKVDSSFFNRLIKSWEIDTTKLCPNEIKSFFSVAVGQNSKNEWVYVLDQNNNLDFSDDKLNTFITVNHPFGLTDPEIQKGSLSFSYEVFNEKQQILKDSSWVFLFKDFFGENNFILSEHRVADFKLGNKNYKIQIKSSFNSITYSKYADLGASLITDEISKKNIVKIGEYLILNNGYYRVDNITTTGDKVFLTRDLDAEKQGGTQLGMKAINFKAQTLKGEKISLTDFRGKYVLLDFWGTWCNPCIAELPALKNAYKLFKDKNFVIIGIANDSKQKLLQYLEGNPLPWVQIPQYAGNDSILKQYHINSYPTSYLLDSSGKIINKNLRGKSLTYRLEQLLLPVDSLKNVAIKGSTKFILEDYKNADAVFARVYSEDNPYDKWTISMYQINNKWIGSENLKPGNYTYEFIIDDNRIKDPANKDSKFTEQGDREISILKVKK